jgi:hypothetical protein
MHLHLIKLVFLRTYINVPSPFRCFFSFILLCYFPYSVLMKLIFIIMEYVYVFYLLYFPYLYWGCALILYRSQNHRSCDISLRYIADTPLGLSDTLFSLQTVQSALLTSLGSNVMTGTV